METLIYLNVIPFTLAFLSLVTLRTSITRLIVPAMLWVHMLLVTTILFPVWAGLQDQVFYASGIGIDRLGSAFVLLTIFVVASATTHAIYYFDEEERNGEATQHFRFRLFYACINIFLIAMTSVYFCENLAFLWICIEATTLTSASLVYYDRTRYALEATWKFLIICNVGIVFALLGTVLIFASTQRGAFPHGSLNVDELISHAQSLDYPLLRYGFFFCLIGYGTKAGIVPMHSWLPDAHSEAPAPASAMLSGALLNCALFGIWKVLSVLLAARPGAAASQVVVVLGTITVFAASLFLIRQFSLKRMWAYSSIENVGLMLVAIGLGSGPLFFLQAVNHSLAKVALFLVAGNITQAAKTKRLNRLHGILKACPGWGAILVLATLSITGAPPFGPFISELAILVKSAEPSHWIIVLSLITSICITFVAVCAHVGRVIVGAPRSEFEVFHPFQTSIVPAVLVAVSLLLGLFVRID